MIENQNAGVTQKKKKYGRLKDFICFFVAAFISSSRSTTQNEITSRHMSVF